MEETYQETYDCDSVVSESFSESSKNTFTPSIELNEGNTYSSEEAFIFAVKTYAKNKGFKSV